MSENLEALSSNLTVAGFDAFYMSPEESPEFPLAHVWVPLPVTAMPEKDWLIRLCWADDIVMIGAQQAKVELPTQGVHLLQFQLSSPIVPVKEQLPAIATLLAAINYRIPVGFFGVSPGDGIFFRYALPSPEKKPPMELVIEILDLLEGFLQKFVPTLVAAIKGKPLPQLIQQLDLEARL